MEIFTSTETIVKLKRIIDFLILTCRNNFSVSSFFITENELRPYFQNLFKIILNSFQNGFFKAFRELNLGIGNQFIRHGPYPSRLL